MNKSEYKLLVIMVLPLFQFLAYPQQRIDSLLV